MCLYYADTKEIFSPEIHADNECFNLISRNPVVVQDSSIYCSDVHQACLGVDQDHTGLYGDTSAYYGTVEQQGRLTLHLHLLLWIAGSLSLKRYEIG